MRDDDKLEVSMVLSFVDDVDKTSRQRVNVLYVEGISRLIKR